MTWDLLSGCRYVAAVHEMDTIFYLECIHGEEYHRFWRQAPKELVTQSFNQDRSSNSILVIMSLSFAAACAV